MDVSNCIFKVNSLISDTTVELSRSDLTHDEKILQFTILRAHLASLAGSMIGGCAPEVVEEYVNIMVSAAAESSAAIASGEVIKKMMGGGTQQ